MKFLLLLLIFILEPVFALEIDERLTARILNTSDSKRTILINRGLEDGLVVDDHAMFFLSSGTVARGVAVRVAPTRSVWSLYRVVDPENVYSGRALALKKTRPIDLTQERSRQLDLRDRGGVIGIPPTIRLAEGADDLPDDFDASAWSESDRQDFLSMQSPLSSSAPYRQGRSHKTWEIWSLASFSSYKTEADFGDMGSSDIGTTTAFDLTVGIEKYDLLQAMPALSFSLSASRTLESFSSDDGAEVSSSSTAFGVAANYHLLNDPLSYGHFIPYLGVGIGLGSTSDNLIVVDEGETLEEDTLSGSFNFLSLAAGLKYNTPSGLGFRGVVEYYRRNESFLMDDGVEFARTLSGPRLMWGMSWRW